MGLHTKVKHWLTSRRLYKTFFSFLLFQSFSYIPLKSSAFPMKNLERLASDFRMQFMMNASFPEENWRDQIAIVDIDEKYSGFGKMAVKRTFG